MPKCRVVIVEGIYALSDRLRPLLDLRVSITGGVHFDLVKRVLRDVNRSGQAPEEIIQQIADTVYPMYKAFIEPDLETAHLRVYNNFNPFTGFMEPTFILKSDHPVSEESIREVFDQLQAEDLAAAARELSSASHQIARSASSKALSPGPRLLLSPEPSLAGGGPGTPLASLALPAASGAASAAPEREDGGASCTPTAESAKQRRSSQVGDKPSASPLSPGPLAPVTRDAVETYDIYLLPPHEDPETCSSWLRMRNRDGRYQLMFEESMVDGPFIISPRISFEVSVRLLGGLMALGYQIGAIMKRSSTLFTDQRVTVKLDSISMMPDRKFVQIQGRDRDRVMDTARRLGLSGTFIAKTYIEQVQLDKLTTSFSQDPELMEDLKTKLVMDGTPIFEEAILGTTPDLTGSFLKGNGFKSITGFPSPLKSPRAPDAQAATAAVPVPPTAALALERGAPTGRTSRDGVPESSSSGRNGDAGGALGGSPAPTGRRSILLPEDSAAADRGKGSRGAGSSATGGLTSELGASLRATQGVAIPSRPGGGNGDRAVNGGGGGGGGGAAPSPSQPLTVGHLRDVELRLGVLGERLDAAQGNRDMTATLLRNLAAQQDQLRSLLEGIRDELKAGRVAAAEAAAKGAEAVARLEGRVAELADEGRRKGHFRSETASPSRAGSGPHLELGGTGPPARALLELGGGTGTAWWMPSPLTVVVGSALLAGWALRR